MNKKKIIKISAVSLAILLAAVTGLVLLSNTGLTRAAKVCDTITITATYDAEAHTLTASQSVEYKNRSDTDMDVLKFHVYAGAYRDGALFSPIGLAEVPKAYPNGKSFGNIEFQSLKINEEAVEIAIEGEDENVLSVALPSALKPGKTVLVSMNYTIQLANIRHRLGYNERSVNLGNWIPLPCIFEDGAWLTYNYSSNGDPFYNDLHNFEVSLTTSSDLIVASSGTLASTKTDGNFRTHTFQSKAIRDFAMVLSKEFKSMTEFVDKVAINYFYLEDTDPAGTLKTAVDSLKTFSELFTKYPYKQLSVVQTEFLHGGMEYGELVYISTEAQDKQERDNIIIHEIAHQWWYGITGNNQNLTAWIDEGLAEYSTLLFYDQNPEYKIDRKTLLDNTRANYTSYVKISNSVNAEINPNMTRELNSFNSNYEYVFMTYVKGLLLFANLETIVGKHHALAALKDFAEQTRFGITSQSELVECFEDSTKTKLKLFFDSYIQGVPPQVAA